MHRLPMEMLATWERPCQERVWSLEKDASLKEREMRLGRSEEKEEEKAYWRVEARR